MPIDFRRFTELTIKSAPRPPQRKPPEQQSRDFDEAALFATLGGAVDLDLLDPPFELRGYRLAFGKGALTYAFENDSQNGPAGRALANPIRIKVTFGAPAAGLQGVPVRFVVEDGDGRINGNVLDTEMLTDANGVAQVTWNPEGAVGTKNTLRARLHGYEHLFTATIA